MCVWVWVWVCACGYGWVCGAGAGQEAGVHEPAWKILVGNKVRYLTLCCAVPTLELRQLSG